MRLDIRAIKLPEHLKSRAFLMNVLHVFAGSIFLSLISLVKVPLYPTPMTLQTLGVFLLGLCLGSKKGTAAAVLYLIEATSGWPVLSGGVSNPLWMIGPNAGFLLGFPLAVFVIGFLMDKVKEKTWFVALACVLCGQACIYIIGIAWLSCFFGFHKAILLGIVPFLSTMTMKVILAATMYKPCQWIKEKI